MTQAETDSLGAVRACLETQREALRGLPLALLWTALADELASYAVGAGLPGVLG